MLELAQRLGPRKRTALSIGSLEQMRDSYQASFRVRPALAASLPERSAKLVIAWTVRCAAVGHAIPAADKMAGHVGFDMPHAVARCKADIEARE